MGADYAELLALRERLGSPEGLRDSVGHVLAEAVKARSGSDDALSQSLRPTIERALQASVREQPEPLVDALFPIIGPMIRKSIAEALASAVEALNKAMEENLSVRSFKYRLEAKRSGRSFAEVVMLRTLVYQVEQVFLIHKTTGLLLQHVVSEQAVVKDPEMKSGMLNAVQSFIEDCFPTQRLDGLKEMRLGDLMVVLEAGPAAVMAAVVRGSPPQSLRVTLRATLERLHQTHGRAFDDFQGNAQAFADTRGTLESCLAQERRESSSRKGKRWLLLVVLAAIVLPLLYWGVVSWQARALWRDAQTALRAEPGLVIVESGQGGGRYFVRGLRDASAREPNAVIGERAARRLEVSWHWRPYVSVEPELVLARAAKVLAPPASVRMNFDEGLLSLSGVAPRAWIDSLSAKPPHVPGIGGLNTAELREREQLLAQINRLRGRIEAVTLHFDSGVTRLNENQAGVLSALAPDIARLQDAARMAQIEVRIRIEGFADATGLAEQNLALSQARATAVQAALTQVGLAGELFTHTGALDESSYFARARRVELKVVFQAAGHSAAQRKPAGPDK